MRFASIGGALVLCALAHAVSACSTKPAAAPAPPAATRGVSICLPAEAPTAEDDVRLRQAIGQELTTAGYDLVSTSCDLGIGWTYSTISRDGVRGFQSISVTLHARHENRTLDLVKLVLDSDEAPVSNPERVAIPVVRAISASPRLAAYAGERVLRVQPVVSTTTLTSAVMTASAKPTKPEARSESQSWSLSDDIEALPEMPTDVSP